MANFFSASQEEQQEILLTFWQRFRVLIIGVLIAIAVIVLGRDYLISSSKEKDFVSASLYQQYLETDDKSIYEHHLYSENIKIIPRTIRLFNKKKPDAIIIHTFNTSLFFFILVAKFFRIFHSTIIVDRSYFIR